MATTRRVLAQPIVHTFNERKPMHHPWRSTRCDCVFVDVLIESKSIALESRWILFDVIEAKTLCSTVRIDIHNFGKHLCIP